MNSISPQPYRTSKRSRFAPLGGHQADRAHRSPKLALQFASKSTRTEFASIPTASFTLLDQNRPIARRRKKKQDFSTASVTFRPASRVIVASHPRPMHLNKRTKTISLRRPGEHLPRAGGPRVATQASWRARSATPSHRSRPGGQAISRRPSAVGAAVGSPAPNGHRPSPEAPRRRRCRAECRF